jgi:GTP-binding protein HflX
MGASGIVIIPRIKSRIKVDQKQTNKQNNLNLQMKEILGLCSTLDYKIIKVFKQYINAPNPAYYFGIGKVEEIAQYIHEKEQELKSPVEFAVVDCPLKASQIFNLENKFHIRVLDRNALILMIFLHHARTNEAKLQIEYAILNHQIPYITELVRRSKLGEHPGYLAGGEYKVDDYFKLIRRRIKKIHASLEKIKTSREQRRKHRRNVGFKLVTIAGYTNAGKSALLTAMTNAKVLVEDRLFSTVSTRTRKLRDSKLLITDTVGFIRNLPTQLVEAFKSTLEEIIFADYIVLVVDISEDPEIIIDKLRTSFTTIDQLLSEDFSKRYLLKNNTGNIKRPMYILVFNKIDIEPSPDKKIKKIFDVVEPELTAHGIEKYHLISAKTSDGLDTITDEFGQK